MMDELPLEFASGRQGDLHEELRRIAGGEASGNGEPGEPGRPPVYAGQFWTAKQREGHSIHEVSYRACYKPSLPKFFLDRICRSGDVVYDPFMGRGTTLVEACLAGCRAVGNDINPMARVLAAPRLDPPGLARIEERIREIGRPDAPITDPELEVFFHPDTLREIEGWRVYFRTRRESGEWDGVDAWLEMVATNRLTGHSAGFFSVYTLPPNQATSITAQRKINAKRGQEPVYRDTRKLILKKSRSLLADPLPGKFRPGRDAVLLQRSAEHTPEIPDGSVKLVVTSPPFLNIVNYRSDNWLRMWFCQVSSPGDAVWQIPSIGAWSERMRAVLEELRRVLRPDGWIAFEVGEVRHGKVALEEAVVAAGKSAGLAVEAVLINTHRFTKTAHCWGVQNNAGGTNSNRIVLFRHPAAG